MKPPSSLKQTSLVSNTCNKFAIDTQICEDNVGPLALNFDLEKTSLKFATTHKLWGLLSINPRENVNMAKFFVKNVDFVVVVDISASMMIDEKLAFVQASIHYLLAQLKEEHRFSLVVFNHEVTVISPLVYCTEENKDVILNKLKNIHASGSTNISNALFTGTKILTDRDESTRNRISSLILITDGLSNAGLSSGETLSSLSEINVPSGCIINTFGFGADHDSKLLHSIALKTKGVYYYVPTKDEINAIFGECVHSILSTVASKVKVTISAQDGTRIINLSTPFQITQSKIAKEYEIDFGVLYNGEQKNILFSLSLRKFEKKITKLPLLNVKMTYTDVVSGGEHNFNTEIFIDRGESNNGVIPLRLDENLNRYTAARSIIESIDLCHKFQFNEAQKKLKDCIHSIENSLSGRLPFCELIIKDLEECIVGMDDLVSFQTGMHCAHAFASMYFLERSSGVMNSLRKNLFNELRDMKEVGYGYLTDDQVNGTNQASSLCSNLINQYRQSN